MARVDSTDFAAANAAISKNPRYTVEIDYGGGVKKYLTTHSDCEVPAGTSSSDIHYKTLKGFSSLSQKIDPLNARSSIGTVKINTVDLNGELTTMFQTRRAADNGERMKTVSIYVGYRGLVWDDYALVQTQVIENIKGGKGAYTINCADIQREARKKIFQVKSTNLTATLSPTATTINAVNTSDFETVYHGTSYSDAPSSTVGYVRIDDEVIRYTGKTSTTFTGCTRGVLNTKAVEHEVDASAASDRQPEVKEYVYLELPAPKLAYALLTGTLYGDAASIPDHWHVGITASLISTSQFTGLGEDLWDTTDDTKGLILRISGEEDVTGKEFVEKNIYRPSGIYPRINTDGQLGVKRLNQILADASYIAVLDYTNVVDFGELEHGKDVQNYYSISWNYDPVKDKNTRANLLIDADSVTTYGETEALEMDFGLMHGSRATLSTVKNTFNTLRDRYAAPPLRLTVTCLHRMNYLDVGDVVRVDLSDLRDLADSSEVFNRSMEIESKRVDWRTGRVVFDLVGSAQRAGVLVDSGSSTILSTSDYQVGSELKGYLDGQYGTDVVATESGGVLTISDDCTLPGNASLAAGGNYYYLGDITINNGVTVTITNNVGIWYEGFLTNNGKIDGKGQGIAASTNGTAGAVGITKATGGITIQPTSGTYNCYDSNPVGTAEAVSGKAIEYDTNGLRGLPTDLRGSSGADGGDVIDARNSSVLASGGSGGDGGAGLRIIGQGMSCGVSAEIDLSGNDGSLGSSVDVSYIAYGTPNVGPYLYSGTGGGGAPGGLFILLDGSSASATGIEDTFTCANGGGILNGVRLPSGSGNTSSAITQTRLDTFHSFYEGFSADSHAQAHYRYAYIHDLRDAEEDVEELTSPPTAITIQDVASTSRTLNAVFLEISVTPPSDGNYYGSRIQIAKNGVEGWIDIGIVRTTDEVVSPALPADGATWRVRAYPISIARAESDNYLEDTHVVPSAAVAVIGTGNTVQTSSTVGDGTNGEGVKVSASDGVKGYDTGGTVKFHLDPTTGLLTCTDANVSGTITATAGSIGGWDISASSIEIGSGASHMELNPSSGIWFGADTLGASPFSVTPAGALSAESGSIGGWTLSATTLSNLDALLDATNELIQLGPSGGSYIRISTAGGLVGVDNTLGTVFEIPLDGSAPTFSSGIINSTVFNITSAGILETSSTAGDGGASGQGVRINDVGIKGWENNNATPNFFLDATDGTITAVNATISGTVTVGAGSSGVANLSDAGSLATQNSVDLATGEVTNKSADNISETGSKKWAGETGADKTQTGLQGGTTITGGGITLNAGGSIKGGQTDYATGTGWFFGYSSGAYKLSAGDSNAYLKWSPTDGLQTRSGDTATKAIDINPGGDNELHFYGDRGNTTVDELATIGISTSGSDTIIGNFGNYNSGNSRIALKGLSNSSVGVAAGSISNIGLNAVSSSSYGIRAYTTTGFAAVYGYDYGSNYGLIGSSDGIGVLATARGVTHGPLKLTPKANDTDPTTGGKGEVYTNNSGDIKHHDGSAWKRLNYGSVDHSSDGYEELPSGLIIQWGVVSSVTFNHGSSSVTFPTTFPTGCLMAIANASKSSTGDIVNAYAYSWGTTGMSILRDYESSAAQTGDITWIAIGH